MSKKTVEFDAHRKVRQPTAIRFRTKEGERVQFTAKKPTKVSVHVRFRAKTKGR